MSRQISPFASLTGAEKQIKWLEYQSIRLPYVPAELENNASDAKPQHTEENRAPQTIRPVNLDPVHERPQPPPEIPRVMPDFQKTRHSQYDAVIARMKQAELQSRMCHTSQISQQPH